MNPADFLLPLAEVPRFLAGAALFLLPGLAAADRLLPARTGTVRLLLAPVFSFTLMPVAGILLSFASGWRATPGSSALLALALALLFAAKRIGGWFRLDVASQTSPAASGAAASAAAPSAEAPATATPLPANPSAHPRFADPAPPAHVRGQGATGTARQVLPSPAAATRRKAASPQARAARGRVALHALAAVALAAFAGLAHALPHLPGEVAPPLHALPTLLARIPDALAGPDYPYPVHVDEHMHLAFAAFITRNGTAADPYTGERFDVGLFSLRGDVHERGFHTGLAQLSLLSGGSLAMLFLWGPAFWAAFLAILAWGLVRPHPGALAASGMVAVLPTDTLFLGASFLVPITFGLAWVLAVAWVMLRAQGAPRVVAILLLVTGAFFIHLVAGAACLLMAVCAAFALDAPWRFRIGLAAVALVPLAWVGPAVADEVALQLGRPAAHPIGQSFFASIGLVAWALFLLGAVLAFASRRSTPHRAVAAFAIVVAAVVAGSLLSGNTSLALYYRASHMLMLSAAILAGHAIGLAWEWLLAQGGRIAARPWPQVAAGLAAALLLAVAVSPGVVAHLDEPYYRIHDEASWAAARVLQADGASHEDVFLSEPWRAMLYNAVTGATPYTVLYPGSPPARGEDWSFYLSSGGASAAWLEDRQIKYVVAAVPPQAPHEALGAGVYRIT